MKRDALDDNWVKFSKFLKEEADEHDTNTAFEEQNKGLAVFIRMSIHFYECGRKGEIPPEWKEAYEIYIKRTSDPQFDQYIQQKKNVARLEQKYKKIEHLNMRPLVGDFMDYLLEPPQKKGKTNAATTAATAAVKKMGEIKK